MGCVSFTRSRSHYLEIGPNSMTFGQIWPEISKISAMSADVRPMLGTLGPQPQRAQVAAVPSDVAGRSFRSRNNHTGFRPARMLSFDSDASTSAGGTNVRLNAISSVARTRVEPALPSHGVVGAAPPWGVDLAGAAQAEIRQTMGAPSSDLDDIPSFSGAYAGRERGPGSIRRIGPGALSTNIRRIKQRPGHG